MASTSIILIIGVATFFNLAIILHKVNQGRMLDALLDISTLVLLSVVFGGTISALSVAMIASMLFSLFLLFSRVSIPAKRRH